jgi:hypothetical protein
MQQRKFTHLSVGGFIPEEAFWDVGIAEREERRKMKRIYLTIGLAVTVMLSLGVVTPATAFHDGGVAHCDGCHTMHNSEGGVSIIDGGTVGVAGDFLTKGSDPSSTCLNCHQGSGSYHVFNNAGGATNLTPGGDFEWLTKTFTFTGRGSPINGYNLGHNIVAADFGLVADTDITTTAPGGTFPAANLACSSCHDPHGKVTSRTGTVTGSGSYGDADPGGGLILGNYRLLADTNYNPGNSAVTFTAAAPVAATPANGTPETDSAHTDYGSGMSEWCANCHTAFINTSVGTHAHPAGNADNLGGTISGNYNLYVATGVLNGTAGNAYLALVPFERGTADRTALDPTTTMGTNSASNVMCLSCHRAHASAFKNAGRWDFTNELLADSHPLATDGGIDGDDVTAKYYGRDIAVDFGPLVRSGRKQR